MTTAPQPQRPRHAPSGWLQAVKNRLFDRTFSRQKAFLRSIPIFGGLRSRDIGVLAQALYTRLYQEGETLFVQGDMGRALFVLAEGQVELLRRLPSGREETIYTIRPGEFFGEMALLEGRPRTASAVARQTSKIYLLYAAQLEAFMRERPKIAAVIFRHMAHRLSSFLRSQQDSLQPEIAGLKEGRTRSP